MCVDGHKMWWFLKFLVGAFAAPICLLLNIIFPYPGNVMKRVLETNWKGQNFDALCYTELIVNFLMPSVLQLPPNA